MTLKVAVNQSIATVTITLNHSLWWQNTHLLLVHKQTACSHHQQFTNVLTNMAVYRNYKPIRLGIDTFLIANILGFYAFDSLCYHLQCCLLIAFNSIMLSGKLNTNHHLVTYLLILADTSKTDREWQQWLMCRVILQVSARVICRQVPMHAKTIQH